MIKPEEALLREAIETDKDLLFSWVNEKSVRSNSFDSHIITYEEHSCWFHTIMVSENVIQYIYEYEEQPVGQARIEICGEEAVINYSISSHFRNQGHGKNMLSLLEKKISSELPDIKYLVGEIKPPNYISKEVFVNLGYQENYTVYRKVIKP